MFRYIFWSEQDKLDQEWMMKQWLLLRPRCCSFDQVWLRPRQNGRHFADDIFKCIFLNENLWISIKISLKFVPKGPINNIPALVQVMAWRRSGDKPLSDPMMVKSTDAYTRHSASMSEVKVYLISEFSAGLTHWGLVTPYGIGDLGQHWFR